MRSRKERTIAILAESGVLPKYGFPTDLVELHLLDIENSVGENRLELSRGMRQAIREYAPGAEIVAGKTLWKSVGLRKPKGQELRSAGMESVQIAKHLYGPLKTTVIKASVPFAIPSLLSKRICSYLPMVLSARKTKKA